MSEWSEISEQTTVPRPAVATGERRQATILFADMAGYTSIAERIGEEGVYNLMQAVFAIMATAVRAQGGVVRDFTGDGIMALFGVPVALEDAALRACRAGLLIQVRLAAAAATLEQRHGIRPIMRVGINTGPVVVGQIESGWASVSGDTVNFASRLQTLAEPGTVVVSEAVHRFVQGLVEATFRGEHQVKGKSERQKVWRIDAVRAEAVRFDVAISRGLTRYVGRESELARLRASLPQVGDKLRVVDMVGEPGMGKSRLLHEFRATIGKDRAFVLAGSCSPDGRNTPFLPFVQIVRGSFRVSPGEPEAEIARKLDEGLGVLNLRSGENLALLLNLLGLRVPDAALTGLDGTLIGLRTRELLQGLLQARCRPSPVVMILEDLHWIDSVSEEVLGKIVASDTSIPLLILATRRPEYSPPWADAAETLSLEPLPATATSEIVRARLSVDALPEKFAELVAEKADGNALFAEEIASFLVERGIVRATPEGLDYDAAIVAQALPASVQSLFTARADRLPATDRSMLQAASVIGRTFDPDLLACVTGEADRIEARLAGMQALDLVHRDGRSGEYVFKHALVRDALYSGLLSDARTTLHAKIAVEIERQSGNRLAEVADVLAHHFAQSEQKAKAFRYLTLAAQRSLGVYSLNEAKSYLRQAEALLDQSSDSAEDVVFAAFLTSYAQLLQLTCEPAEIVRLNTKYRQLVSRMGTTVELAIVLHYEVWALCWLLKTPEAGALQGRLSSMCDHLGDDTSRAYSEAGFFFVDAMNGKRSDGIVARGDAAIAAASRTGDPYISSWVRFMVGWHAMHRGHMSRSRKLADDLRATGLELRDPRATGLALWLEAWTAVLFDDYQAALAYGEEGIRTAITPFDKYSAQMATASALVLLKRVEIGGPMARKLCQEAMRDNRQYHTVGGTTAIGVAMVLEGSFGQGIKYLEDAIHLRMTQGYIVVADFYRLYIAGIYLDMLEGAEKPPLRVMLRNLGFLVGLTLRGRQKLQRTLDLLRETTFFKEQAYTGGVIHFFFGRYYALVKNVTMARQHLSEAQAIVAQYGASPMLTRIEAALERTI